MAITASTLYSGNVTNLLLTMQDKDKNYNIDLSDPALRSICVQLKGEVLPPYIPATPPVKAKIIDIKEEKKDMTIEDYKREYFNKSLKATAASTSAITLSSLVPNVSMLTIFALSCWVGNASVKGVTHALHSPLMAMTNAISGMTIVGGMLQLGGGIAPQTVPQALAAGAVGLSAVNLVGGTIVTKKMLDMFRRPTDPPEFYQYYLLPAVVAIGGSGALFLTGLNPQYLAPTLATASALGCIGGISCLSSQETSRLGISVGVGGILTGLAATLSYMSPESLSTYGQLMLLSAGGGGIGYLISKRIGPTELPQAVAGFHSLVGIAATSTALGDFLMHDPAVVASTFHNLSTYLGAWMGSITATGSIIAYGKLSGQLDSAAMALKNRDLINTTLAGISGKY